MERIKLLIPTAGKLLPSEKEKIRVMRVKLKFDTYAWTIIPVTVRNAILLWEVLKQSRYEVCPRAISALRLS